jgi:hypothetical protein|uniref:Cytosolic iron-sulfur assembly component 2B n=1 Tax=Mus musculus TaxID=10090 RepID=A0A1D5RMI0_MOUSE
MVGGGGSGGGLLENANPLIYERSGERPVTAGEEDEEVPDSIDAREIFDIRRCRALAGRWGLGVSARSDAQPAGGGVSRLGVACGDFEWAKT